MLRRIASSVGAFAMVLCVAVPVPAQESEAAQGWDREFELGVNLLQSSYSNNWNGGEKGSVVWNARFDGRMEKQLSDLTHWRNTLKLVYGQTHNQDRVDGKLVWRSPDKSDDLIDFESLFLFTPDTWVEPFVAVNFKSMFQDLTDPSGRSLNFNPLTFKETAGFARELIKKDDRFLMTRFGAAFTQNVRATFVDPAPDETTESEMTTEAGLELVTEYRDSVLDGEVAWESTLTVGLPLVYSGKSIFEDDLTAADLESYGLPTDIADYTTMVNADWENTFTTRITSLISVKLFLRWVYKKYDNSVKPVVENGVLQNPEGVGAAIRKSGQLKQTLAVGLSYKF